MLANKCRRAENFGARITTLVSRQSGDISRRIRSKGLRWSLAGATTFSNVDLSYAPFLLEEAFSNAMVIVRKYKHYQCGSHQSVSAREAPFRRQAATNLTSGFKDLYLPAISSCKQPTNCMSHVLDLRVANCELG